MDRTIQSGKCTHCHGQFQFLADLLYHDMHRKFMVSLVRDEPGKPHLVHPLSIEVGNKMPAYTLRFVTSYNQLIEKIKIFEAGLNDWAIEALKIALWYKKFPTKLITNDSVYFYAVEDEGTANPKLCFGFFDQGQEVGQMMPPRAMYDAPLRAAGEEKMQQYGLGEWKLVNQSNVFFGQAQFNRMN
jgi:CpXC motif protein